MSRGNPRLAPIEHEKARGQPSRPYLFALILALGACDRDLGDPTNLRGVFDGKRPRASASAPAMSRAKPARSRKTDKRQKKQEAERAPTLRRDPIARACLARAGEPAKADRRGAKRPGCRRARIIESRDPDGLPRYGCVFTPHHIEKRTPLPLLVFFHSEHETSTAVHRRTKLRSLYHKLDLTGEERRRGFVILAPQARRIRTVVRFDTEYLARDNADVRHTDALVDGLITEGLVDPRQIYTMGASSGGRMAAMYAMLRPDRVAAFATYGTTGVGLKWTCEAEPTPAAIVYRACDTIAPCADVEQWLSAREDARAPTLSLRLGATSRVETTCVLTKSRCRTKKGRAHHARWPKRREGDMLRYLGRYSLRLQRSKKGTVARRFHGPR